ncbi:MAG TPA: hypothetical protein VE111_11140 [Bradyrhizobium sp.]|nr:hypothetical protein [Bradyrhizobium sp.]
MIRRLIAPLAMAIVALHAGRGFAQGAFPAPLPGAAPAPSFGTTSVMAGATPFLSSPLAAPATQADPADDCMKEFLPLRQEAETRGKLIKAASDRHAPPDEACKLIGNFSQSEIKMIKYVEGHSEKCGIPPQISDQLKSGHKNTEAMLQKVCSVAQQMQKQRPAGPRLSEVLGSAPATALGPAGPLGDWLWWKKL